MAANGIAEIDFGVYPGVNEVTLDVTGQTGFISTSNVEAYIQPKATADHSADEHRIEEIQVAATYLVDGTIRIYGRHTGLCSRSTNGHSLYGKYAAGWVWV